MIGKILCGRDVGWLLSYLYGPGRRNEHLNPHLVASWDDHPAALEPSLASSGRFDLLQLTRRMEEPLAVATRLSGRPVWHCAVRAAPTDRTLTDAEWGQIARDIMHATGLAPQGDDYGCRWVAVRHAEDHIHLFATLARQDGARAKVFRDFYQVAEVCHATENRLGLASSAPSDRSAAHHVTRAEQEKAARIGRVELPRTTLQREVRTAAAAAACADDFLARLTSAGLIHRLRYDDRDPTTVIGYAVALPGDRGAGSRPVFFGGRQLAPDLSWPKLCHRWQDTSPALRDGAEASPIDADQPQRLIPSERREAWRGAADVAAVATLELAALSATDTQPGSDLAAAAAGLISVVARAVEGRVGGRVTAAADAYDRAGREPNGRVPTATATGDRIRMAARLLAQAGRAGHQDIDHVHALIAALVDLTEAIALLRDRQDRPAQAVAARHSAQRLAAALPPHPTAGRTPTAAPTPSLWADADERSAHMLTQPPMPSASPRRGAQL